MSVIQACCSEISQETKSLVILGFSFHFSVMGFLRFLWLNKLFQVLVFVNLALNVYALLEVEQSDRNRIVEAREICGGALVSKPCPSKRLYSGNQKLSLHYPNVSISVTGTVSSKSYVFAKQGKNTLFRKRYWPLKTIFYSAHQSRAPPSFLS